MICYGPGEGEATLLVFPDGTLGVVDGCKAHGSSAVDPVAEFIAAMPGAPRIRFVALTHPHGDHYGGLGPLVQRYFDRIDAIWTTQLVGRLQEEQFCLAEIELDRRTPDARARLVDLHSFLAALNRAVDQKQKDVSLLSVHKRLLSQPMLPSGVLDVHGCGPADWDVHRSARSLPAFLKAVRDDRERPGQPNPNETSGALLVRWQEAGVLLTGDMLNGGSNQQSGWNAACHLVCQHPVQLLSAAHHASPGAHHREMLAQCRPPVIVVTPFKRGQGTMPPQQAELDELAAHARVLLTAPPVWLRPRPVDVRPEARPAPPGRGGPRSEAMPSVIGAVRAVDADNAVAVTLSAMGTIEQILLGGRALRYSP